MSKKKFYFCEICQTECRPRSHSSTHIYCGHECAVEGRRRSHKRITTICSECGKEITIEGYSRKNFMRTGKAYCSNGCGRKVQISALTVARTRQSADHAWRKTVSARMKKKNPMWLKGVKKKMIESMRGKTFLSRGGNGQLTKQQKALHSATGLVMEYPILTARAKGVFASLPNAYKVDLADQDLKLAIEIDGKTHKLKLWKFLDSRKTQVLNTLGWTVLRFTNEEVDRNLEDCVQMISSTISKLKTTTFLPERKFV